MSPVETALDRRLHDGDLGPAWYAGSRIACRPDFRSYKRRLRPTRPSSRSRCYAASTQRSLTRSPHMCQQMIPDETVRAALGVPTASSLELQAISSPRLQRMFKVKLAGDRRHMVLVTAPPSMLRLLRSERLLTHSESTVVRWMTECASKGGRADHGDTSSRPPEQIPDTALLSYLPRLVVGAPLATTGSTAPFNIFEPPPGLPISTLDIPLSKRERASIDYQAGLLIRRLSELVPANGKFGPALAVLAPRLDHRVAFGVEAASTWSVAFHSLLESALRDGEDMTVVLAYSAIRRHFRRLGHVLDGISKPRLVIVDAFEDANLLVSRSKSSELPVSQNTAPVPSLYESGADRDDKQGDIDERQTPRVTTLDDSTVTVTGLRDWSRCIFGDTLFAAVFCEQPNENFLRGFNDDGDKHLATDQGPDGGSDEDKVSAEIRLLLYQCYHNVVQIVKAFYRPTGDSSKRELEARKRLHGVLTKLDQVEDWPRRRHRRPSGEVSPAKKLRSGDSSSSLGGAERDRRGKAGEGTQSVVRQDRAAVEKQHDTDADDNATNKSLGREEGPNDSKKERAKK